MSNNSFDAIVIGGGIVGASTAYHLGRAGAKTLLVDRMDRGRATEAGAGILAPEISQHSEEPWFNFAVEAVAHYPTLVESLLADGVRDSSYAITGMLLVAISDDEADAFAQNAEMVLARQERRGLPTRDELHPVTPDEARELFPALGDVQQALYYSKAARVDGGKFTQAMRTASQQHGVTILQSNVERLLLDQAGGRVQGVVADAVARHADAVVVAGGAWSESLAQQIGVHIPVEPQRGQIAHLEMPDDDTTNWPIIGGLRGHYLVTWPENRVVAGATRETGSGFEPYTSAAGVKEVLDEALRVAPGLAHARLAEVRVGLRPFSADGLPVIGDVPGFEGLFVATGHGPTGLQLGPYSGKVVASQALGAPLAVDTRAFHISRFMGS